MGILSQRLQLAVAVLHATTSIVIGTPTALTNKLLIRGWWYINSLLLYP